MIEKNKSANVIAEDDLKNLEGDLKLKDLPAIIGKQIDELASLDKSVTQSLKAAEEAKEAARTAGNMSVRLFSGRKEAIEELQTAGVQLAEAVQISAETQKISFQFQTQLAEITKYLFGLGASSLASNRFVVRELELRMKGASKEKLSELAKKELHMVVKQLKDQEDILLKQIELTKFVQTHENEIKKNHQKTVQLEIELGKQSEVDEYLQEKLLAQQELDRIHSEQIAAQIEVDKLHSEQLQIQAENDRKLAEKLTLQEEMDQIHSKQIEIQKQTSEKMNKLLQNQIKTDELHDEKFSTYLTLIQSNQKEIENINERLRMIQENLEKSIAQNTENIGSNQAMSENLRMQLTDKFDKNYGKITFAVAFIGLLTGAISLIL